MWSGGGGSAGPEGIGGTAIVIAPYVNRFFRSDGKTISKRFWGYGMWQVAGSGIVHAAIDKAQHVPRSGDHVPIRGGRTVGDSIVARAADVVGLVHDRGGEAKPGTQVLLSPVVDEAVTFYGYIFRRIADGSGGGVGSV